MHFVIKIFPEIFVKSRPVRKQLTKILASNLRHLARAVDPCSRIIEDFEKIEAVFSDNSLPLERAVQLLANTPGVAKFSEVSSSKYEDIDHIARLTQPLVEARIANKTFVVRARRSGRQDFKSVDVERQVGEYLLHHTDAKGVSLKEPEERVELEIREHRLFVLGESWIGLGGYPLGGQGQVLSLISGGFDSSVASYLTIKRGLITHYLFFNLGGRAHEMGAKEIAHYVWNRFSASHEVNFIGVPFAEVVAEILQNIPKSYMGVALKRMMYRAADRIAREYGIKALVTGESVAQVSSQTLANLAVIDSVSETLILRPLIASDKGDIIRTATKIGTQGFAAGMPEFCGVISSRPTASARQHIIEDAETTFDFSVLDRAVAEHRCETIETILESIESTPVDFYEKPLPGAVIIDVRHPDEVRGKALKVDGFRVLEIPYFRLQKQFSELESKTTYLFYCDRGVMSRLHAELLIEEGFRNVAVYRPQF